jgi:predicted Na+-dependent transporter
MNLSALLSGFAMPGFALPPFALPPFALPLGLAFIMFAMGLTLQFADS